MIVWAIQRREDAVKGLVICRAENREAAKRIAAKCLLGNPDDFIVTPLSSPGEAVVFHLRTEGKKDATVQGIGW